jgi:hypothetical protein
MPLLIEQANLVPVLVVITSAMREGNSRKKQLYASDERKFCYLKQLQKMVCNNNNKNNNFVKKLS